MDTFDLEIAPPTRPRTATVLGLLAIIAAIFSYLAAYAGANALAAAEVIKPWARSSDPRPRWFGMSFVIVMGCFLVMGALARFLSRRQMRRIDEMEEPEAT